MEATAGIGRSYEKVHALLIEDRSRPNPLILELANTFCHDFLFGVECYALSGATTLANAQSDLQNKLLQVIAQFESGSTRNLLIGLCMGRSAGAADNGTLKIW